MGDEFSADPPDHTRIDISDLKQGAHLQLGATPSTSADEPAADASAQRDRGVGQDAENRLAIVAPPSCALTHTFIRLLLLLTKAKAH